MKLISRLAVMSALMAASLAMPAHSVEFPQTSDRGAPPRSIGGGSRGEICLDVVTQPTLTALLPHNSLATTYAVDAEIPSALLFYVPETGATLGEITVVDAQGEEVYQQTVTLPESANTLAVTLPQKTAEGTAFFEAGQFYYWDFAVICDETDRKNDVSVGGGIQRAEPDAAFLDQLAAVADDPLAQAELYASVGAWQEALVLVAGLYEQDTQPWQDLLESVDLTEIAAVDAPALPAAASSDDTGGAAESSDFGVYAQGDCN
ncbi:MAG: DUF928 domain-containing protein [Cyanobacteria bacterium P01_G01_bin.38]